MKTKLVRLFTPCFNVAEALPQHFDNLLDLETILARHGCKLQVLCIDDCSQKDDTRVLLQEFADAHPNMSVKLNETNRGNAPNIISGYQWALEDASDDTLIGCLDSDGEHNSLAFRRHIDWIDAGTCDGVVGSIIYPEHKTNWIDMHMMRLFGAIQAQAQGANGLYYIQSGGHQLQKPEFARRAIEGYLPRYQEFFAKHHSGKSFPRWGMHGVIDHLLALSGARLMAAHLECYGEPPNRDYTKILQQADAAMSHELAMVAFKQEVASGKISELAPSGV